MTVKQRLLALLHGNKIRCSNWPEKYSIYFKNENDLVDTEGKTLADFYVMAPLYNIFCAKYEWEIYQEKKECLHMTNFSYPYCPYCGEKL